MSTLQVFDEVIVSEIPDSYATASLGSEKFEPIDLAKARRQHAGYIEALKKAGCNVTVLPADERYPDCVFVEDPAVIVGSTALITKPGHATRSGEVERMKPILRDMGLICVEITDPAAKIDGGDVQWTGKEILVGISDRTNIAGVNAVAEAFPGYKTIGVPVSGPLHLKTLIGLVGEDTFCVATESRDSLKMFERIRDLSSINYKAIFVPEDNVANTILINGKVICKGKKENPRSFEILQRECKHELIEIESSEIEKAVGSLTCLSLRFNRPRCVGPAVINESAKPVTKSIKNSTDPIELKKAMKSRMNGVMKNNKVLISNASTTSLCSSNGSDEER